MTIHILGPKDNSRGIDFIDTTSKSRNWSRGLSPFFLGPIQLYGKYESKTMENAWQNLKVYQHHVDENENPTEEYFKWAEKGWNSPYAQRYPMGRGAIPLYSYWDGQKLSYIEARKKIYAPLYARAVLQTDAYQQLQDIYEEKGEIWLWDYDGFDHLELGMSYEDVINCETKKMGHAFVLAMLLENERIWIE